MMIYKYCLDGITTEMLEGLFCGLAQSSKSTNAFKTIKK